MNDWQETWHHVHAVLGRKWAFHVLRALSDGEHGFNELKRRLGVTAKPLSERLSELRCVGLVERDVTPNTPPESHYRLTADGERFVSALLRVEELVDVVACDCEDDCESFAVGDPPTCEC